MEKLNFIKSRQSFQAIILIFLLIFAVRMHSTLANTMVKDTIIWEHYFNDMSNKYDMTVRTIDVNPANNIVIVSLVYSNGTAIYCLNAQTGEILWRLDPLITYTDNNYLIYVNPIAIPTELNAVFLGGEAINADNLSSKEISDWYKSYPVDPVGFMAKIDINTGEIIWFNTNYSTATAKIEIGYFNSPNKLDIVTVTPDGIIFIDEGTGTNIWNYTLSKPVASYSSRLFTVESASRNYSDLIVCFGSANPRTIKLSGKTGELLWTYNDSSHYSTVDAITGDITNDGSPDLIFCTRRSTQAINGSDGALLWQTSSPVLYSNFISDIAMGTLDSTGAQSIVGTFLDHLFFLDAVTGQIYRDTIIEENDHSTGIFILDLNNDGQKEIISPSFGSSIAILDANGKMHHRIKTRAWASDILIADVLGTTDLELIAGTVTFGWVGVLGHGLSSGVDLFFPILVIGGSLGLLGLIGVYFWWYKGKKIMKE